MVSASFATANHTVNSRGKLPKAELLSESYQLPLGAAPLYLCLLRRNSCAAGGVLFSYSGAIFERSKTLSIDYSGAKYTRFPPKIAAMQKSLF